MRHFVVLLEPHRAWTAHAAHAYAQLVGAAPWSLVVPDADTLPLPAPGEDHLYTLTGSFAAAYDDTPCTRALTAWLRTLASDAYRGRRFKVLGICFGAQIVAQALGGHVERLPRMVFQATPFDLGAVFRGAGRCHVAETHSDAITRVPPGFVQHAAARAEGVEYNMAFSGLSGCVLCTQFHPEFTPEVARNLVTDVFREETPAISADCDRLDAELAQLEPQPEVSQFFHAWAVSEDPGSMLNYA